MRRRSATCKYKLIIMNEKHTNEIDRNVKCCCCEKLVRTERGLRQLFRITNCQTNLNTQEAKLKPPEKSEGIIKTSIHKWGDYTNKQFDENEYYLENEYFSFTYW